MEQLRETSTRARANREDGCDEEWQRRRQRDADEDRDAADNDEEDARGRRSRGVTVFRE